MISNKWVLLKCLQGWAKTENAQEVVKRIAGAFEATESVALPLGARVFSSDVVVHRRCSQIVANPNCGIVELTRLVEARSVHSFASVKVFRAD